MSNGTMKEEADAERDALAALGALGALASAASYVIGDGCI